MKGSRKWGIMHPALGDFTGWHQCVDGIDLAVGKQRLRLTGDVTVSSGEVWVMGGRMGGSEPNTRWMSEETGSFPFLQQNPWNLNIDGGKKFLSWLKNGLGR